MQQRPGDTQEPLPWPSGRGTAPPTSLVRGASGAAELGEEPNEKGVSISAGFAPRGLTWGRLPPSLHVSPEDRAAGVCGFTCQREREASSGLHCSLPWRPAAAQRTLPWTRGRPVSLDLWTPAGAQSRGCHRGTRTFLQPKMRGRGSSALTRLLSGCHAPRVPRLRDSGRDGAKREAPGEQPNQNRAGSPVPARPRLWAREAGVGAGAHARCHWTNLAYRLRSTWAHGSPLPAPGALFLPLAPGSREDPGSPPHTWSSSWPTGWSRVRTLKQNLYGNIFDLNSLQIGQNPCSAHSLQKQGWVKT